MMITNISHIALFVKKHLYRLVLVCSLVMFLIFPRTGNCVTISLSTYSSEEYVEKCSAKHFDDKYSSKEASCWSCRVVNEINNALLSSAELIISPIIELSKLILLLGAAIWIALYFLKSLSSLATQDTAKNLDGVLPFMIKVAVMYLLIDGGIAEIISWIIQPLFGIGMDVSGVIRDLGR